MKRKLIRLIGAMAIANAAWAVTVKELNETFTSGDYAKVVLDADRTLTDQGTSLSDEEAYGLIMLKAEALLRQGNAAAAAREFVNAGRAATDIQQLAWARASAIVVRRSNTKTFTPRTGDKTPIDILNPDTRKQAFLALYKDMLPEVNRRQETAMRANTLPALEDAVLPVADATFLEIAATGASKEMGPALKGIGERARKLISEDIIRVQRQVSILDRIASQYDGWGGSLRGLTSRERDELRTTQAYVDRVLERVRAYRLAASRLTNDLQDWDRLELQVVALQTDIQTMLSTVY